MLESILSVGVVIASVTIAMGLFNAPSPLSMRRTEDITRFSYSFLMRLAEAEVFDKVMFTNGALTPDWEAKLTVVMSSLLPPNTFFALNVYNCTVEGGVIHEELINRWPVSNAATPEVFDVSKGVAGVNILYTTKQLFILRVQMQMTSGDQP